MAAFYDNDHMSVDLFDIEGAQLSCYGKNRLTAGTHGVAYLWHLYAVRVEEVHIPLETGHL